MPVLRWLTFVYLLLALTACQTIPAAEAPAPAPTAGAQTSAGQAPSERANVPPSAVGAPARVAQPTPTPAPPTPTPTITPTPTVTRTPTPLPTPIPQARRLTEGGCCSAPSWSADSAQVIFIDKPSPDAPTAYYAVDTTKPGSKPTLFLDRIASWVGNYEFLVTRRDGFTTVERRSDGQVFRINTGRCSVSQPTGCQLSISPDRQQVSWSQTIEATGPFERRTTRVWIANLDGSNARVVATLLSTRAGASWFPDSKRLLLSGRPSLDTQELVLTVLNLETGAQQEITRAERINRATLSPQSGWLAYAIAFHDDAAQNGLWVVRTDGTGLRKLPFFGPFSWRSEGKLLYLPLEEQSEGHPVIEYDVEKDTQRVLIDPKLTPFKIAFGDYAISPNGRKIAYVDSVDRNIWMLDLPE